MGWGLQGIKTSLVLSLAVCWGAALAVVYGLTARLSQAVGGFFGHDVPISLPSQVVSGVSRVQDDRSALLQLLLDTVADGLVLEIIVLGPIDADVFVISEELHHSHEPCVQVEALTLFCAHFPGVDGQQLQGIF